MSTCKSCGAPVLWIVTRLGRRMPVDAEPHSKGNILVLDPPNGRSPIGHVLGGDALWEALHGAPERVHRSHFSTCPDADKHRKGTSR